MNLQKTFWVVWRLTFRSAMLKLNEYCRKHYHHTIARIPPYILGILLGWFLHKKKDTEINLNKVGCLTDTCLKIAV